MSISLHAEFRKHVFDSSPMAIVVMDAQTNRYIDCNLAAVKVYKYASREEVVGKYPLDFSAPFQYDGTSSIDKAAVYIAKALHDGAVVFEWKHKRPNGEVWDAEVHLLSFTIDGQQLLQFSLIDITERKNTEKMQNLLHDLMLGLNSCNDLYEGFNKVLMAVLQLECLDCGGIYTADPVDNSLSIAAHSGLSKEFVALVSCFKGDSPNALLAMAGDVRYGVYSDIIREDDVIRRKEGLRAFALIPILAEGRLIALLNISSHKYDDIPLSSRVILETIALQVGGSLLRLRTANALRESQELFELFMFHSPVYAYIKEVSATESRVLQASDSFKTLIGVPGRDIRGKTMQELFPADFAARITADDQKVVANKKVLKLDEEFVGRSFTTIKFPIVIGTRTLLAGYTIDITERKRMEDELQKTQKLESLGLLAGGIAHDFNNLLAGIFAYMELARESCADPVQTAEYLDQALSVFDRAKALTQQLLTFSRGGVPVLRLGSLPETIKSCVGFALSGSNVLCRYDFAPDIWVCDFDPNQMGQVLDNIVRNAMQAMPLGGVIIVSCRNVKIEKDAGGMAFGDYVKVSIQDKGIGIPKEIISRIFDPFYSTKAKGSGLGLAMVYSIVKKHGGFIEVESEPGRGATFHIYLPARGGRIIDEKKQAVDVAKMGSGTILVMDDEEYLLSTMKLWLKKHGYTVLLAANGLEAIEAVRKANEAGVTLVAVVLDLTVPGGMGGAEAVSQIKKLIPNVPVIAASGYAEDPVIAQPQDYGFDGSLAKPYRMQELSAILEKLSKKNQPDH